ncbi:helicase DnaB [Planomonospora sphaerica]|uniref:Helicase DnaB n=1 Tax=Planomonospora sphaerica TaxID=161355 RepID=A0A161MCK4_9ACTN|nr:DnaB-like helicase N-terminal domain-containing protein [Planomonospora sphaerica]GAT68973.1 helicase DnaB [Planomonospora sphaerica]
MTTLTDQVGALYSPTGLDIHIEQALLGALLLEPEQLGQVRSWLEAADFARPAHQELYTALLTHADAQAGPQAAGHADPAEPLAMAVFERVQHVPGLTASYLHDLMQACPVPGHATSYALLVVEADTRRALALHTARLAGLADAHLRGEKIESEDAASLFAVTENVKTVITNLAARLNVPDLAAVPLPNGTDLAAPLPVAPAHLNQQDQLLTALIADPSRIPEVRTLLDPEDFTDPGRARLFALLTTMADHGEAIDLVTVMNQAQHAGLLAPDRQAVTEFRQRFADPGGAVPWYLELVQQIQEASALACATTAVIRITDTLARPGLDTRQMLAVAARELATLTARQPHHVHSVVQPAYEPPDAGHPAASTEPPAIRL